MNAITSHVMAHENYTVILTEYLQQPFSDLFLYSNRFIFLLIIEHVYRRAFVNQLFYIYFHFINPCSTFNL